MARVVVTGANRGIGLEFCRQFKKRGDDVIAVCRTASAELKELGVEIVEGVDVSSESDVAKLARAPAIQKQKIDILINNAGILRSENLQNLDLESIRKQFEVNSLGPLMVTHALRGQLAAPAKVGIVTSRMGSVADNTSGGMYGYRMSKAAVNMAGVSLAQDLKDQQAAVALLHPGYVKTEMTGNNGMIEASESVTGLLARLDALNLENSGTFWHTNGEVLPW
ncbi:MAG: SDR family oxidoreductase [bacterium]|nr:SDR family oxidoreductase [bacterium]